MKTLSCLSLLLFPLSLLAAEPDWPRWEGWELMGQAGAFDYVTVQGERQLDIHTETLATALRKEAPHALTPDLEFSWQWQVDSLPSTTAEDTEATHHYFAVSVIFDNGRNLSYVWSAALPLASSYPCPLPDWTAREVHVVVDNDSSLLGTTRNYRRNILADYERYIGGEVPQQVTRVWIVALAKGGDGPIQARLSKLSIGKTGGDGVDYL